MQSVIKEIYLDNCSYSKKSNSVTNIGKCKKNMMKFLKNF